MPYYIKKKKSDKPKKRQPSQATLVKKLDKVFSQYIRLRDALPNGTFRCPTCGRILPFAKGDCSHLYSRRHMATRFDEDNCVMECAYDNRFNSEHLIKLNQYVLNRIGETRYKMLSVKAHSTKKWSCWELEELIKYYSVLVRKLQSEKNIK